ncbi:MAG: LysR family transcriptional regulator [Acetatifactor sp.]|nr:LysR family transcriptional regulator [Acetatifactor sp.]
MVSNLEYYKVFYHVASLGSLTMAARALSISQPAVSQSIRQLEQQLGTSLFYRMAKGVHLTKEGETLFEYVARGYEQLEIGEQRLRQMRDLEAGEIRIGASDMTLQYYLLPYLEQFHEKYPEIKVIVTNAPTPETLGFLEQGKIDFGVVSSPFETGERVKVVPVRELEDIFVAGRRFIACKNRMLDLQELGQLPMIFLEKNTSTRNFMDEYLESSGVRLVPEFELATSDMIVQFALRSLGVGCVVRDFAQKDIDSGKLFELRFNKMIPRRSICIVYDSKARLSTATRALFGIIGLETAEYMTGEDE